MVGLFLGASLVALGLGIGGLLQPGSGPFPIDLDESRVEIVGGGHGALP